MRKVILSLLGIVVFCACATNPVTGRKQLSLVGNSAIFPQSFSAYKQTLQESKLSTDVQKTTQIKTVGTRIQKAVEEFFRITGNPNHLDGYVWEYNLIESKELNAWCMPGGKVAFYTGILPVCQSDTGIAVVMGHEISHAIANHGAERMSQGQLAQIGAVGAQVLTGVAGASAATSNQIMQLYGVGAQVGLLKYSRKNESEADEMGLIFMALAGYDPTEAPKFWGRMVAATQQGGQGEQPEFLSTHPNSTTRIQDLTNLMPIAQEVYKTKSIQPYLNYKKASQKSK